MDGEGDREIKKMNIRIEIEMPEEKVHGGLSELAHEVYLDGQQFLKGCMATKEKPENELMQPLHETKRKLSDANDKLRLVWQKLDVVICNLGRPIAVNTGDPWITSTVKSALMLDAKIKLIDCQKILEPQE